MNFARSLSPPLQVAEIRAPAKQESAQHQGSLPLKKRKLLLTDQDGNQSSESSPRESPLFTQTLHGDAMAALALLSAAAGGLLGSSTFNEQGLSPLTALSQVADAETQRQTETISRGFSKPIVTPLVQPVQQVDLSPLTPIGSDREVIQGSVSGDSEKRGRVHHKPLSAPLPGGCHGRTSRNNSFCRRQPCYKGSTYCKLHYQQYVVAGTKRAADGSVSDSSSLTNTPLSIAHQDRRFTGAHDEVRCAATTTRGRACAYVAVNESKYCHLHADYDNNPPPRRGGSGSGKARQLQTESGMQILPRAMQGCPTIPDLRSKSIAPVAPLKPTLMSLQDRDNRSSSPSMSSEDSFVVMSPKSIGTSDHNEIPKVIPLPPSNKQLLSSLTSDQWLNQRVMIGTGPLIHRTGVVERWGNGWVTVRVRDGLTHNRRSIELYLLSSEDSDPAPDQELPKTEDSQQIPHCVTDEAHESVLEDSEIDFVRLCKSAVTDRHTT